MDHPAPQPAPPAPGAPSPRPARLSGAARRADLIEATHAIIAEEGLTAATLRRVADRAGVSNGLIRHHFSNKAQMILAAYAALIERMTAPGRAALARLDLVPRARLAGFVRASLDPSVVEPRIFSVWASFISLVHVNPEMEAVHREGYLGYRTALEPLIGDVLADADGPRPGRARIAALATQLNALLDGLWVEACLLPDDFAADTLAALALEGAGRILKTELEG